MVHSRQSPPDGRIPLQTHQIHVAGARERVQEIRTELFAFPEVLDVFVTSRSDSLVVVCAGHPRPAEWLCALRARGYEVLARRRRPPPVPVARPLSTGGTPVASRSRASATSGSARASRRSRGSDRVVASPTNYYAV